MTDFTNCPIVPGRAYNGANGSKIAVEYGGGIYMLKFPPSGERKPTNLSYTNSCISEHLASSIFNLIGINAQKTELGTFSMAVLHKDAQRNIRIDRLDPRFSETALREYYHKLHRMPTEMQQEYRQENAPAKPKWQPTELQPIVRRARYLGKLPRRYPKVSGFMACYYHYCALLRKAYHGKTTKRCYFLLREDFLLFSRYQQQTKFLWENHIETMPPKCSASKTPFGLCTRSPTRSKK